MLWKWKRHPNGSYVAQNLPGGHEYVIRPGGAYSWVLYRNGAVVAQCKILADAKAAAEKKFEEMEDDEWGRLGQVLTDGPPDW